MSTREPSSLALSQSPSECATNPGCLAAQPGAAADAARGDKIGAILQASFGSRAFPIYQGGAAKRHAVGGGSAGGGKDRPHDAHLRV